MWPSPLCLQTFSGSPLSTGSSPDSLVWPRFPTCPKFRQLLSIYQHGRFLPTPGRESPSLGHIYVCISQDPAQRGFSPGSRLWFPLQGQSSLTTSAMPTTPAWPQFLLAPKTQLISHLGWSTSCSLTPRTALWLMNPSSGNFHWRNFLLVMKNIIHQISTCSYTRGNSKMNHS